MADAQKHERRKRDEWRIAMFRKRSKEEYWYPNQEKYPLSGWNPGDYFSSLRWNTDEITYIPPMSLTDDSFGDGSTRESLQIVYMKIASLRGGLQWPIDVFGLVTARDVLDNCRHNVIFARARSNSQTITEEHPYIELTGPTRAVMACMDPGNIEIVLKVKGATVSDDRDLSFLVLTLKSSMYCSFHEDYPSKRSTLSLGFYHIDRAVEATISVLLTGGSSRLPVGFQGVFTASTASLDDVEVMLLDASDGKLHVAEDGTVTLSRRVVSVGYDKSDWLKVSILALGDEGGERDATRDDAVFMPRKYGRSCGVLDVGTCKMQVTIAWSLFVF